MKLIKEDGGIADPHTLAAWLQALNVRGMAPGSKLFPEYSLSVVLAKATTQRLAVGDAGYKVPDPVFRCLKFIEHCVALVVKNLLADEIKLAARIVNFADFYLQLYRSFAPFYSIDNPGLEAYNTLVYGNFNCPTEGPTAQQLMCARPLFMVLQTHFLNYKRKSLAEDFYNNFLYFGYQVRKYSSAKAFDNKGSADVLSKCRAIDTGLAALSQTLLSFCVSESGKINSVVGAEFCKNIAAAVAQNFASLFRAIEQRTGTLGTASDTAGPLKHYGVICAKNILLLLRSAFACGVTKLAADVAEGELEKLFQLPKVAAASTDLVGSLRELGF
jgi:hypothetical protein